MDMLINLVIYLSTAGMAIVPFLSDIVVKPLIKEGSYKVTFAGVIFFIFAALVIFFSVIKDKRDTDEKQKFVNEVIALRTSLDSANFDAAERVKEGFSLNAILTVKDAGQRRRKFIFDVGDNEEKNRVSLYLDIDNNLVFRVIDNTGEVFSLKKPANFISLKLGSRYFLHCEVGISDKYSYLRLFLDDREIARQPFEGQRIDLKILPKPLVTVGNDMTYKFPGKFILSSMSTGTIMTKTEITNYMNALVDLRTSVEAPYLDSMIKAQ